MLNKKPKHYNTDRSKSSLQSQTKAVGTLPPNPYIFSFSPVSSTSQYCLSQLTRQMLYTNIER